jgi:hypothetical protein
VGGLVGGGSAEIGAVQAQLAVAKRCIDEGAVMRLRRIVVLKGPEEPTGHTHAGNRDAALLLERANHRDQGAQEGGLLGGRELADRLQQKVRPSRGGSRLPDAGRGEQDNDAPAVARSRFFGDQTFALQGGNTVGGGCT